MIVRNIDFVSRQDYIFGIFADLSRQLCKLHPVRRTESWRRKGSVPSHPKNFLTQSGTHMADRETIRILIIDDDPEFAGLLRMHLIAAGYAAEVAEDAVDGGRALLAQPPALVLCDIGMPHLNGLELLSLMQSDQRTASIPVVFISGRSDNDTVIRAVELGAADFLAKPVTREQLLQTVEACLSRGGRKAALPNYGFPPVV